MPLSLHHCCFVVAVLCLASPSVGAAQPTGDVARARSHHQAGVSYFEQGRYREAAEQFRESHRLSRRNMLLINVSRAHELAGNYAAAAEALDELLTLEPNHDSARTLQSRANALRERAAEEEQAELAQRAFRATATPTEPDPQPQHEPLDLSSPEASVPVGPVVLFSMAGASLIGAVISNVAANNLASSLEDRCPSDICPPDAQSDIDTGNTLNLTSHLLFGGSAALALGGLLWLLLDDGAETDSEPRSLSLSCDQTGCSVWSQLVW